MSDQTSEQVHVRVLPLRALSVPAGEGTTLHLAGHEVELEAADARELEAQGFVEKVKRKS